MSEMHPPQPRRRPTAGLVGSVAVALLPLLGGCGSSDPYAASTAAALQHELVTIADSAASHHYVRALQELAQLQLAADRALKQGDITAARHQAIVSAIGQVHADLTLLQTQAEVRALQQRQTQLQQQAQVTSRQTQHTPAPAPPHHAHGGHGHGGD